MVIRRQLPVAQQAARRAELDTLRTTRLLTLAERAEAESLTNRLYQREWRRALSAPHPQATANAR